MKTNFFDTVRHHSPTDQAYRTEWNTDLWEGDDSVAVLKLPNPELDEGNYRSETKMGNVGPF